jgi:hypothetical protein
MIKTLASVVDSGHSSKSACQSSSIHPSATNSQQILKSLVYSLDAVQCIHGVDERLMGSKSANP